MGLTWSQMYLSTLDDAEAAPAAAAVNKRVQRNEHGARNHDDDDDGADYHIPSIRSGVCESILEEDSGDLESSGPFGTQDRKLALTPECHPAESEEPSEEFGELTEQVGKRMSVHARGAPSSGENL